MRNLTNIDNVWPMIHRFIHILKTM